MKRKKKKLPDDVLRWGPFELARFGRTTYARNLMTPEEFREHLEHLARQVPNVAAEIDARVTRIAEIVRSTQPDELLLRAWWMFAVQHLTVKAESEIGADHVLAMRMIDYVQSVIAAVDPAPEQTKPADDVWEELKTTVDELFTLVNGPYMAARTAERKLNDPAYDERHEELYFKSQVYWTTVRGDRYPVHLIEQLRDFLTPQDDILREVFGVSAEEIVTAVENIEFSLTLGINKAKDDFAAFHKDCLAAMEEDVAAGAEFSDLKELGKYSVEKRGWAERRDDIFDRLYHFGLFDLQKITKLPSAFLRELAWEPGEEPSFFSGTEMKGWPLREWPIHRRPFLHVGDRFYCFDIYAVRDHLYRIISRTVFRLHPDLKQRWEDRQREASEAAAVSLISGLLNGAGAYAPAYYQWPPTKTSTKNWCECDGIVVAELDEHLFIIEVKAGAFTYTAPTNDFPAHIASAKNLIDKPLSQGRRFLEYLNSAEEVPVFDRDHHELTRLRRDRFDVVTICGVTLDALTDLAAQAEHLKPMGGRCGHYARMVRLHRRPGADSRNPLTSTTTRCCFDGTAIRPGQKLPPVLQQVVDRLATQQTRGRAGAAAALLDLDSSARQQLSMLLDHAVARQRVGGPPTPASVYGKTAVTVFCWRDGVVARNSAYAREMTLGLASLAGEERRLLFELMFDADGSLIDVAFAWLRPDSIEAADRGRIDELAEATYRLRVAAEGKLGRNAPCPCGSGQKYKKCHGS